MEDIKESRTVKWPNWEFWFKSFIYGPGKELYWPAFLITTVKYPDDEIKEIDHYLGHIYLMRIWYCLKKG